MFAEASVALGNNSRPARGLAEIRIVDLSDPKGLTPSQAGKRNAGSLGRLRRKPWRNAGRFFLEVTPYGAKNTDSRIDGIA